MRISHLLTGIPSPDYFPFASISADVLPPDAFPLNAPRATSFASAPSSALGWLWRLFGTGKNDTTRVHVPREPRQGDGGLNLATALQYGPATGLAPTRAFIREFTERIYAPAYDDWTTLVHTGNTDGCDSSSTFGCFLLTKDGRWGSQVEPRCQDTARSGRHAPRRGVDVPLGTRECAPDRCALEGGPDGWSRYAPRRAQGDPFWVEC